MNVMTLLLWFAVCAVQDARHRQLSNWLTLGPLVLALTYLLINGKTWIGAEADEGGWALVLCLALTMPGYLLGKLGAADVKLLAALALATDRLILLGTLIGAGLAILLWMLAGRKFFNEALQRLIRTSTQTNADKSKKHPFAPYLFSGFILSLLCFH